MLAGDNPDKCNDLDKLHLFAGALVWTLSSHDG